MHKSAGVALAVALFATAARCEDAAGCEDALDRLPLPPLSIMDKIFLEADKYSNDYHRRDNFLLSAIREARVEWAIKEAKQRASTSTIAVR